ncbi:HAD family hydrolase [Caldimonas brevitalea]|uniref:Phosphate acetyltransferase n=1 Tax=Caldimonas brevitalea TaxID=413882 RepID=A0A0G3BJ73_9BURK|nr:HAD family hydrolase [Caldimonas brevitalea]AKJ27416.1 phosphate acetyltransferase [Caldimonas brevitalea]
MQDHRPIIALDADGVLLDFNRAYALAWQRAFGVLPAERDPQAYWALDRWQVERLEGERLARFRDSFDEQFWGSVPPMAGAIEACHALKRAGYELVCVSALPAVYAEARRRNLLDHGFPIDRVVATGHTAAERSPKAEVLEQLRPVAFVDDYLPYMVGVPEDVHTALVLREPNGSPNVGEHLALVKSQHADLAAFAAWWLDRGARDERDRDLEARGAVA